MIKKKEGNILQIIPFNSARKRASTAVLHPDDPNKIRVFCKGAPEIVAAYCSSILDESGERTELSEEERERIIHEVVL